MATHPPEPCCVHRLAAAPNFVGREEELEALRGAWLAGGGGVIALIGLGGAGKTAVAARFLQDFEGPNSPCRPHGLFVWSFYQEPDAGLCLRELYRYFAGDAEAPARGT